MLELFKRWWLTLNPIPRPPPTCTPDLMMTKEEEAALRREIMANQWGGLSGEEVGRRLYGETRTFFTDHIHRQGGSNIGEDDESRTFQLEKIYRQHQE